MIRTSTSAGRIAAIVSAIAAVAALAIVARGLRLNAAATALLLQLAVVVISAVGNRGVAAAAAVSGSAALTLFLHPIGSFRVSDPENWIVLISFLLASLVAARLVARARAEAASAAAGREEIGSLYRFSVELFSGGARNLAAIGRRALDVLDARRGGLLSIEPNGSRRWIAWEGDPLAHDEERLAAAASEAAGAPLRGGRCVAVGFPVSGGGKVVLLADAARGGQRGVESVGALLALAAEHEVALGAAAHVEAVRESDAFKTALLRAVSHDLSTPLTAITLAIDALRRELAAHPPLLVRLDSLGRDVGILRRRIDALLALGRIEAGLIAPRAEPTPPADLFRMVREQFAIGSDRALEVRIDPRTPDLETDPALALVILVILVENADLATRAELPISLRAFPEGPFVRLEIADRGSGVPALTEGHDVALADLPGRGLGLEIARSFAAVLSGSVTLRAREGGGTIAAVVLPRAEDLDA